MIDPQSLLSLLLSVTAAGALVVGLMLLVQRLITNHISPTFLYLCWAIVLVRFIVVWAPESPASLTRLWQPPNDGIGQASIIDFSNGSLKNKQPSESKQLNSPPARNRTSPPTDEALSSDQASSLQSESQNVPKSAQDAMATIVTWRNASIVAIAIWGLGVVWCMGRLLIQYVLIGRLIRQSQPVPEPLSRQASAISKAIGCWFPIRICSVSELESPAVTGIVRPTMLIPDRCLEELNEQELEMVLLHELMHVRRFDGLWQIIGYLIASIHWFNPMAQLANRRMACFRELSCDRAVINHLTKNEPQPTPRDEHQLHADYGRTILKLAQLATTCSLAQNRFPTKVTFGFIGKEEFVIQQRIKMIARPFSDRPAGWLAGVSLLALLVSVGFTSQPKTQAQEPNQTNPFVAETKPTPATTATKSEPPRLGQRRERPKIDQKTQNIRLTERNSYEYDVTDQVQNFSYDDTLLLLRQTNPNTLTLTGLKPGVSTFAYQIGQRQREIEAEVLCDVRAIQRVLDTAYPTQHLRVVGTPSKMALLRGFVKDQATSAEIENSIRQVTELVIVNQLTAAKPIAFQLKVYKIDLKKFHELDINIGIPHPNEEKSFKKIQSFSELIVKANRTMVSSAIDEQSLKLLATMEQQNVATLVDNPTLVSVNGRRAEFLSGGEIPIAVAKGEQETIEFRDFGTKIQLTPTISGQNELAVEIMAQFSQLDPKLSSGTKTPGFRVRRLNTGRKIRFDQTICLSGDWLSNKSDELVLLITPKKVNEVDTK